MFLRIQAAVSLKTFPDRKQLEMDFCWLDKSCSGFENGFGKKIIGNSFLFFGIKAAVGLKTFLKRNEVTSHHITPHHGKSKMFTHFTSH